MLALAEPPHTQPTHIPGLKYPPEWHQAEEDREQAYLNAHIRRHLRCNLLMARPRRTP